MPDQPAPPPPATPASVDDAVSEVKSASAKGNRAEAERQQKQFESACEAVKGLYVLADPKTTPAQRRAAMEKALAGLTGALVDQEGADELAEDILALAAIDVEIYETSGTTAGGSKDHVKRVQKAAKALATKIAVYATKRKMGKNAPSKAELKGFVDQVAVLVELISGVSEERRQAILEDAAGDLLTSKLVMRQLEWFVSENILRYGQAAKIGWQIGAPIGRRMAADLATGLKTAFGTDVIVNLEQLHPDWINEVALGHPVTFVIPGGAHAGWSISVIQDSTAGGQVRIWALEAGAQPRVHIFDGDGREVTGEAPSTARAKTDGVPDTPAPGPSQAERRVTQALKVAREDATKEMTAAAAARKAFDANLYDSTLLKIWELQLQLPKAVTKMTQSKAGSPERRAAESDIKYLTGEIARVMPDLANGRAAGGGLEDAAHAADEHLRQAIVEGHRGLLKAAFFEKWGPAEYAFLAKVAPQWAITAADVRAGTNNDVLLPARPADPAPAVSGGAFIPRGMSPALITGMPIDIRRWIALSTAALLIAALAGLVVVKPKAGEAASGPVPTSAAGAPSSAPSAVPTPSINTNPAPVITSIVATFNAQIFTTSYTATATDGDGDTLEFTWVKKQTNADCGTFRFHGHLAQWEHPDIPGGCPAEAVHPADIIVTVDDGHGNRVSRTYPLGSAAGRLEGTATASPSPAQVLQPSPVALVASIPFTFDFGAKAADDPLGGLIPLGVGIVLLGGAGLLGAAGQQLLKRDCSQEEAAAAAAKAAVQASVITVESLRALMDGHPGDADRVAAWEAAHEKLAMDLDLEMWADRALRACRDGEPAPAGPPRADPLEPILDIPLVPKRAPAAPAKKRQPRPDPLDPILDIPLVTRPSSAAVKSPPPRPAPPPPKSPIPAIDLSESPSDCAAEKAAYDEARRTFDAMTSNVAHLEQEIAKKDPVEAFESGDGGRQARHLEEAKSDLEWAEKELARTGAAWQKCRGRGYLPDLSRPPKRK